MGDQIASDAGMLGAIGAGAVAGWEAVKWLIGRKDAEARALDQKEAEMLKRLEDRVNANERDLANLRAQLDHWRIATRTLADELARHDPANPRLKMVADQLAVQFPNDPFVPPMMSIIPTKGGNNQ